MDTAQSQRIPLPWTRSCFVCGQDNATGLQLRSFKVADRIELPLLTDSRFVGWNGVMHGGFTSTILDEVMTWAAILESEKACFAAQFSIRLQKPLAPELECIAVAKVTQARRRVVTIEAWLQDRDSTVFARAQGRYMPVPDGHTAHLRDDFVTEPGCLDVGHISGF